MFFPQDYSPIRHFILLDVDISKQTKEAFSRSLEEYEDIMLSNSSGIGYTKHIEMDIVKETNELPVASNHTHYH